MLWRVFGFVVVVKIRIPYCAFKLDAESLAVFFDHMTVFLPCEGNLRAGEHIISSRIATHYIENYFASQLRIADVLMLKNVRAKERDLFSVNLVWILR